MQPSAQGAGRPHKVRTAVAMAVKISSSMVALSAATSVLAQAVPGQTSQIALADTAAEGGADNGAITDIIVTARRRAESMQDTPVSVTALSGEDLLKQNVRNFSDLRGRVSNLEIVPLLSGGTSFTVRGIGQTSNQVNSDAKAGFYIDEIYVARQEGNDLSFYDIGSVQVLKGPQGTLFGKNTTAGAILLTTNRPTDKFEGFGQVRVGSYKRIDTEGAINVPLTDSIYGRVSFRTQRANGFIDHVLDEDESGDIDNRSIRLQLRATSGGLTADLLGEYNRSTTDGGARIPVGCLSTAPYVRNYDALHSVPFCTAYPVLNDPYKVYGGATLTIPTSAVITDRGVGGDANSPDRRQVGRSPFNDTSVYTANFRLNYALSDDISIRSISGYRRSSAAFYTPTIDAPNDIYAEYDNTKTDQFTQELTLGGSALDDKLQFLTGLFYFYQKTGFLQDTGPDWIDPLGYVYDGRVKYQSYAAFVQASYKFTPALELTVGARYTYDKKDASSFVFYAGNGATYIGENGQPASCGYFTGDFLGGIANCGGAPFTASGKDNWDGFDPKFQLSYRWSEEIFTYISASHGYNSGGFNQQIGATPPGGRYASTYNPEKLWAYEAGFKADLFDRRLQLNVSGFFQDYSDIQSTVLVTIGNISTRQFQSAASAEEKGFEAEFVMRPIDDLTIRGNGSYLHQKYKDIIPGALIGLDTPVNSAPKYQYSAAASYNFHVGASGLITPTVDVRGLGSKPACFSSGTPTVPQISTCKLPAYALVGARLDYLPSESSPWKVALYSTNLFDKVTQLGRGGYSGGMGVDSYTPGRPFEVGAELLFNF